MICVCVYISVVQKRTIVKSKVKKMKKEETAQ